MTIQQNVSLSEVLFYKIGGSAKVLLIIENQDDLIQAFEYIEKNHIQKIMPIGLGSNLLMSDSGFDGAVLWFSKPTELLIKSSSDGLITSFASHLLDDVIQYSFQNQLQGLEWAGGLPSTIGAAIRGNVGCFGSEIKDFCVSAEVFEFQNGKVQQKKFTPANLQFSYRNSIIKQQKNLIVSSVQFQLYPADESGIEKAKEVYTSNIEYRKTHHPVEYPSCGSVFKNIVKKDEVEKIVSVWPDTQKNVSQRWHGKVAIGYIIDRLGFTGMQVGGAQVSEKHSNYIINKGGAKFDDVFSIILQIKEKFFQTFGFEPEQEVEIVY